MRCTTMTSDLETIEPIGTILLNCISVHRKDVNSENLMTIIIYNGYRLFFLFNVFVKNDLFYGVVVKNTIKRTYITRY